MSTIKIKEKIKIKNKNVVEPDCLDLIETIPNIESYTVEYDNNDVKQTVKCTIKIQCKNKDSQAIKYILTSNNIEIVGEE
jgi:hypothetical protein